MAWKQQPPGNSTSSSWYPHPPPPIGPTYPHLTLIPHYTHISYYIHDYSSSSPLIPASSYCSCLFVQ
eukprot:10039851-Karenia_brevis.AAC.1